MLKKILIAALWLSSQLAFSNETHFYLGASVGPETANFAQNARIAQLNNFDALDSTHLSGGGTFGSIFGGAGFNYRKLYLGAELNGNISSVRYQFSNNELIHQNLKTTSYKMPYSLGLSALPGILLTESTLFYGRLGYANGNFRIRTTDTSLTNLSRNLDGFRWGLGINQTIYQFLSFRVEYSHTNYRATQFFVVDNLTSKTTRINPKIGSVQFGLVANFSV